jgi:hypothetical protein
MRPIGEGGTGEGDASVVGVAALGEEEAIPVGEEVVPSFPPSQASKSSAVKRSPASIGKRPSFDLDDARILPPPATL